MNLITLAKAKTDRGLLTVTGKCGDSDDFVDYVNSGCQRLLRRGDWFQTLFRAEVCVHDNCIVWPRQYGKIRAINICRHSTLLQGQWASFLPFFPGVCNPLNCDLSDFRAELQGLSPIFKQIPCGQAWYVRAYVERNPADLGKTITIYGIDDNGQVIRSVKADGTYSEGFTLTTANPFASTPVTVRRVTRVTLQDGFVGNVRLYGYDANADLLHDIGLYQPGETEPAYVYSQLMGGNCAFPSNSCSGVKSVTVLAKLNPDPLRLDTDILQIQNMEALKQAIQARRKEDNGDLVAYRERMQDAVEEMNREEQDWLPNAQIPIKSYPFGSATLRRSRIGYVN